MIFSMGIEPEWQPHPEQMDVDECIEVASSGSDGKPVASAQPPGQQGNVTAQPASTTRSRRVRGIQQQKGAS